MRWFSAHREPSATAAACRPRAFRVFKAALFAFACMAGVGFSAGEHSAARADDGGMVAFLLGGNAGGRVGIAAPARRLGAPAARPRTLASRKVAVFRAKAHARHARLVWGARHARPAGAALVRKASFEIAPRPEPRATSDALDRKAKAAAARPDDAYLKDKTLRRGDIVATTDGLRVFLGSGQFPYRLRDFAPVTTVRGVAQRSDLLALDRTLRGIRVADASPHKRARKAGARKPATATVRAPQSQTVALAYAPTGGAERMDMAGSPTLRAIAHTIRRIDLAGFPTGARPPQKKTE